MGSKKKPRLVKKIQKPMPPEKPVTMAHLENLTKSINVVAERLSIACESTMSRVERLGKVERELSCLTLHVGSQLDRIHAVEDKSKLIQAWHEWSVDMRAWAVNEFKGLNDRIDMAARAHAALRERIEGFEKANLEDRLSKVERMTTFKPSLFDRFVTWLNKDAPNTKEQA